MVYESIVARAGFHSQLYAIDGTQVAIGTIDKFEGPLFLAVSFSKILYGTVIEVPAIVISSGDIRYLLDNCFVDVVKGLLAFAIGHELGHIKQWEAFPETCKGKMVTALEPEVIADCYSVRLSEIDRHTYHVYLRTLTRAVNERDLTDQTPWIVRKFVPWYNRRLMAKRMKYVDGKAHFGNHGARNHKEELVYNIASKMVDDILSKGANTK